VEASDMARILDWHRQALPESEIGYGQVGKSFALSLIQGQRLQDRSS